MCIKYKPSSVFTQLENKNSHIRMCLLISAKHLTQSHPWSPMKKNKHPAGGYWTSSNRPQIVWIGSYTSSNLVLNTRPVHSPEHHLCSSVSSLRRARQMSDKQYRSNCWHTTRYIFITCFFVIVATGACYGKQIQWNYPQTEPRMHYSVSQYFPSVDPQPSAHSFQIASH